jgi:fermentation-respiration switch protein FrsA (DUF1100 family)
MPVISALFQVVVIFLALLAAVAAWAWTIGPFRVAKLEGMSAPVEMRSRETALALLAEHVYGPAPERIEPRVMRREVIAPDRAGGVRGVEQWLVDLGAAGRFNLVLVLPENVPTPAPVIAMQSFCGNQAAFPGRPAAIACPLQWYPWICKEPAFEPALRVVFGEHINAPPYELIASRGYALAMVYGGDIVPDNARDGRAALARWAPEAGALSAWAWIYSRMFDVLATDERLDASRIAVWGQSRQGKAALLAGARDERFAAVVGLQAGRGGDALTAHRSGESVRGMTQMFPHWFGSRFAGYVEAAPPVDQHELLAAIAPRPLLTGHAWRDNWADPASAKAASDAASDVYERLGAPRPHFLMREGRHGIERVDWQETLDFLDARMR